MLADYSHINIGLVYAIWANETSYGISLAWLVQYNPGGLIDTTGTSVYRTYINPVKGFEDMLVTLNVLYNEGLVTIDEIMNKWSEADDSKSIASLWHEVILKKEVK